jgi:glutamine synthetase
MSTLRFNVVETAFAKKEKQVEAPGKASSYFGSKVFNREKMFRYLPEKAYKDLTDVIDNNASLSHELADAVAAGMRKWALEMGVTHYTHWFHPLNEGTAEKHDAFCEPDGKGGVIEKFSGKLLIQQEPDASSFPSGGIRNTFEARGYSAWDPSSPAFIVGDTLCIPTIFIAYTGESLDYKAPLLKALEAVNKAATAVCHYFNEDVKKVYAYLGWEQEYFLVDEGLYAARPDLLLTGRTLMGQESSKTQQLDDHYFGAIPTRVMAFMQELEIESLKLGIPVKTRHNEVAPNQFELAPVFEECNLANDHNLMIMSLMRKVSRKHGFRVLLHEKPFKGINGSGKHNNGVLGTIPYFALGPGNTEKTCLPLCFQCTHKAPYRHNACLSHVFRQHNPNVGPRSPRHYLEFFLANSTRLNIWKTVTRKFIFVQTRIEDPCPIRTLDGPTGGGGARGGGGGGGGGGGDAPSFCLYGNRFAFGVVHLKMCFGHAV